MPEIMRQFGQTVLVALAGALLVAMLFVLWPGGGNILTDIGSQASTQLSDRGATGGGSEAFNQHSARSVPQASVNSTATKDVEFPLVGKFTINASDGAVWSHADGGFMLAGIKTGGLVQIESIRSSDGTEQIGGLTGTYSTSKLEFSQSTGIVKFLETGVYLVRLRLMDSDNVEATYTIPLVVDFAPQG